MTKKLDLGEKIVCNVIGKMFVYACDNLACYEVSFCEAWLNSNTCKRIFDMDETLVCQSSVYLFSDLMNETTILEHEGHLMDEDVMYWAGYTLTYWMLSNKISGKEILDRYDVKSILQQYDVLHTQSSQAAVTSLEKEQSKGNVLKNTIFYK